MPILSLNGAAIEVVHGGTGKDLVLLPTLLADITVYDEVMERLAAHRSVHAINFPGFGGSTGPIGPAMEDYADLIAAAMAKLGLPRQTDVLGNGFGGFVAGTLAIRHGQIFDKLVLLDTGAGFPEDAREPLRVLAEKAVSQGMESVLDAAVKRMFPAPYIAANPAVIERRKAQLSNADPKLFANAALALTTLDNTDLLPQIRNPTLIVVGADDQTTPPVLSHELKAGIPGAKLIELPGIGHCPQLQDPAGFLHAIGPFLELP